MARTTSQLVSVVAAARAHRPVTSRSAAAAWARPSEAGQGSEGRAASLWGRAGARRTVRTLGTTLSRRGDPGPRAVCAGPAGALTGSGRAGEAGELSSACCGGSVRKVSFRRGLEPSLRGYLWFCVRRRRCEPSPWKRGPGASVPSRSGRCELLRKAPGAPGLPNSWVAQV